MAKSIAVLGMGRFGRSVAKALFDAGHDVLIADRNEELLDQISGDATYAVTADLSDENAIADLGLGNMDAVVVAMGMDLEASILCVMIAKEAGVGNIIAKAKDARMGDILTKVGAHKIVYPEKESGRRTAKLIVSDSFLDFFEISDKVAIVEMKPKPDWIGKNIKGLDLRRKYKINIVAIKHGDSEFDHIIDPELPISEDDKFLVMMDKNKISKL